MPSVAIVGGGISGLSTAYYLSKAGIPSTLIEARARLGGVIQTERILDCVIEAGPDSFLSVKPWAMDLIRELGLEGEVIGSNDQGRITYIRRKGRLVPLPEGVQILVPTKILPVALSPLLSWSTKIRIAMEYFRRADARPKDDRSVTEFVEQHYGREVVDYLAEPLLSGIYGGDPAELSVASVLPRFVELEKSYGSLTRGVLAERPPVTKPHAPLFRTLRGGLESLIQAVSNAASRTKFIHTAVDRIERSDGKFRLLLAGNWMDADHIVLACEAHQGARLTQSVDARVSELLSTVGYRSAVTVALGFLRAAVREQMRGFGFLVPRRERRKLLACTWVGNKFPHRTPESLAVLRCFVGGAGGDAALAESDEAILDAVRQEVREIAGVAAEPLFWRVYRWPSSMAQYTVGHEERIRELEGRLESLDGLHIAGNGYHGIGVPDCVRMGKQVAERIARVWTA